VLVRYFMTRPVISLADSATCRAALELFHAHGFRRMPVEKDGVLVGLLHERVAARAVATRIGALEASGAEHDPRVSQLMLRDPPTTTPGVHLEDAARAMIEQKVSALPVLDGGKLVGILTESDLFRALVSLVGDDDGVRITIAPPRGEKRLARDAEPALVCSRLELRLSTLLDHESPGGEAFTLLRASGPRWRELAPALVAAGYTLVQLVPPRADAA
jgi:acetoin utilization protein AcuB